MYKTSSMIMSSMVVFAITLMASPVIWAAKLGIVVSPKEQFNHQNITEAYQLTRTSGADLTRQYLSWTDVETAPGVYDWQGTDYLVSRAREAGLRLSVDFQIIRTASKESRPADLESLDWRNTELIERYSNLVLMFLDRHSDIVDYLEIGSEVNIYLQNHQDEIEPFRDFYDAVYDNIKAEYPDVSVGTVFAYHELVETDSFEIYDRLNIGDHDGFTLFIYGDDFAHTEDPSQVIAQLNEIEILTGDRPFAIEEVGWTTATSLSSSASEQEIAVAYLFDYLEVAPARLEFITWFGLHDIPSVTCDQIAGSFGIPEDKIELFSDFLCHFGLRSADGVPRPAWNEWVNRAALLEE